MTDYYSILRRAVVALDPNTAQARRDFYARARSLLADKQHTDNAAAPASTLHDERAAFEAAVKQLKAEMAQPELTPRARPARQAFPPPEAPRHGEHELQPSATLLGRPMLLGVLAIAAALIVSIGAYAVLTKKPAPVSKTTTGPVAPLVESRPPAPAVASSSAGEELEPGVDGGSSEAGLPYFYRRQPVYYRTIHPVGTIIIDPTQRFLYLVQPRVMALRYGIGIGSECTGAAALRRVTRKIEWPEWTPSAEVAKRRSYPARMAGGPGNPLGARALVLDDAAPGSTEPTRPNPSATRWCSVATAWSTMTPSTSISACRREPRWSWSIRA